MKSKFFKIYELISPNVYRKYGERSWMFFDPRLLETLDFIREYFGEPIIINDWYWGGNLTQRGLRENTCPIVRDKTNNYEIYLSAHVLGMGVDLSVNGYLAEEVREKLIEIKDLLPYPIRLEKNVLWVHIDVMNEEKDKIYIF